MEELTSSQADRDFLEAYNEWLDEQAEIACSSYLAEMSEE